MFCAECGAKLEDGAAWCSECGTRVEAEFFEEANAESFADSSFQQTEPLAWENDSVLQSTVPLYEQPVTPVCSSCGAPLSEGFVFCKKCGMPVDASAFDDSCSTPYRSSGAASATMQMPAVQPLQSSMSPVNPSAEAKQMGASKGKVIGVSIAIIVVVVAVLCVVLFGVLKVKVPFLSSDEPASVAEEQPVAPEEEKPQEKAPVDESAAEEEVVIPTITFDTTQPFWGAWALFTDNRNEADRASQALTDKGYTSQVIETAEWSGLAGDKKYGVTTGTWKTSDEANAMVALLKKVGYPSAVAKETGEAAKKDGEVSLTVNAKNGSTLTGTVRRDDAGYVIADSSTREYTASEISAMNLSDAELCIAWNEPFAREGYHFKNSQLQAYFESCPWYHDSGFSGSLSGAAAKNNETIRDVAGGSPWKELAAE